ncbi:hypothetical protein KIPB_007693, partial [Kipferlia bialata]|eukprot:g7693.t1
MPVLLSAVEAMYFNSDSDTDAAPSTVPTAPALRMPVAPVLATSHSGLSLSPTAVHNVWESSGDTDADAGAPIDMDLDQLPVCMEGLDADGALPQTAPVPPVVLVPSLVAPVTRPAPLVLDYSVSGASLEECFLSQSRMGAALQDEETAGFQDAWGMEAASDSEESDSDRDTDREEIEEREEVEEREVSDSSDSEDEERERETPDAEPDGVDVDADSVTASDRSTPSLSGVMQEREVEDTLNIQTKRPRQFVALFKKMFAIDRSQKFGVLGVMVLPVSLLVTAVFLLSFLLPWFLSKTLEYLETYEEELDLMCDLCKRIEGINDIFPLEVASETLPEWVTDMSQCEGSNDYGIPYVCDMIDLVLGNPVVRETIEVGPGCLNSRDYLRGAWLQYYDESGEHGVLPVDVTTLALLQESLYDDDGIILNDGAQAVVDAYTAQWYLGSGLRLPYTEDAPLGLLAQLPIEILERVAMEYEENDGSGKVELFPQFYRGYTDRDRDSNDNYIQVNQLGLDQLYHQGTQYDEHHMFKGLTQLQDVFPFATITIPEDQGIESTVMTPEIQTFLPPSNSYYGPYHNAKIRQHWKGEFNGDGDDYDMGLDAERESLVSMGFGDAADVLYNDYTDVFAIPGNMPTNPDFELVSTHLISPINDLMARLATSAYRTATQDRGASINFSFSSFTDEHFSVPMLLSIVDEYVEVAVMLLLGGVAALSVVPYVTHMPVHEREHRIKDMLRINGVSGTQYWGSAFLYLGVVCSLVETLIVLLGRYIFRLSMFRIHGLDLLLAVFVGGAWAMVSFGLFLSNFFKSTQI